MANKKPTSKAKAAKPQAAKKPQASKPQAANKPENLAIVTRNNRVYGSVLEKWDPQAKFFDSDGNEITHEVNLSSFVEGKAPALKIDVVSNDYIMTETEKYLEIKNPFHNEEEN